MWRAFSLTCQIVSSFSETKFPELQKSLRRPVHWDPSHWWLWLQSNTKDFTVLFRQSTLTRPCISSTVNPPRFQISHDSLFAYMMQHLFSKFGKLVCDCMRYTVMDWLVRNHIIVLNVREKIQADMTFHDLPFHFFFKSAIFLWMTRSE